MGENKSLKQGIDGSARKPALRQDIGYMVGKTDHIAPYLGAFGAYLMGCVLANNFLAPTVLYVLGPTSCSPKLNPSSLYVCIVLPPHLPPLSIRGCGVGVRS